MTPPTEVIIGVDVGTTATKVVAFGLGTVWRRTAVREYPLLQPAAGRQVQDPEVIMVAVVAALGEAVAAVAGGVGHRVVGDGHAAVESDGRRAGRSAAVPAGADRRHHHRAAARAGRRRGGRPAGRNTGRRRRGRRSAGQSGHRGRASGCRGTVAGHQWRDPRGRGCGTRTSPGRSSACVAITPEGPDDREPVPVRVAPELVAVYERMQARVAALIRAYDAVSVLLDPPPPDMVTGRP